MEKEDKVKSGPDTLRTRLWLWKVLYLCTRVYMCVFGTYTTPDSVCIKGSEPRIGSRGWYEVSMSYSNVKGLRVTLHVGREWHKDGGSYRGSHIIHESLTNRFSLGYSFTPKRVRRPEDVYDKRDCPFSKDGRSREEVSTRDGERRGENFRLNSHWSSVVVRKAP